MGFPADRLPGILFLIAVMNSGVTVRAGRIGMFSEETALMCDARAAGALSVFLRTGDFCGRLYADGILRRKLPGDCTVRLSLHCGAARRYSGAAPRRMQEQWGGESPEEYLPQHCRNPHRLDEFPVRRAKRFFSDAFLPCSGTV